MKKCKRIHPEDIQQITNLICTDLKDYLEHNIKHKWLRTKDVCEQLGISNSTLKKMRINNQITFSRIGKVYYYDVEDIDKLLEKNKVSRLL
ncbi:helix-turn-helix domain-containing protein [Empedobacter falsenii]|uniref:helix-turn-helix domain-containing protein n=1 Tax=Empedobacter falsenii TaxID=343874 RepID=UPI003A806039